MTGKSVRGVRGFVPKEGANFDYRLNVRLHRDEVEAANQRKKPDESLADFMRAALRFYILYGNGEGAP